MRKKRKKIQNPAGGRPRFYDQKLTARQIRTTDRQWSRYARAAANAGMTRSEWIRDRLDKSV